MEPRRDDGDDITEPRGTGGHDPAAMEPRRDDGDDARRCDECEQLPQWSPVVTTGTTLQLAALEALVGDAAMEPRRDDGDDIPIDPTPIITAYAAMEPRRDDGDDARSPRALRRASMPQWSPVVTTGTTSALSRRGGRRWGSRNGAPS